jgi:hypothetical protein
MICIGVRFFLLALCLCTCVNLARFLVLIFDMASPQKFAMDSYLSELTTLIAERQTLNKRISKVEKVLRGMIDLLDTDKEQTEYIEKLDELTPPAGLTEAIQQVLQAGDGKAFSPTEIRDKVKPYLLNHSNEMASVHTTLKRIVKNNRFVEAVEKDGRTAYRWVSMSYRIWRRSTVNPGASGRIGVYLDTHTPVQPKRK